MKYGAKYAQWAPMTSDEDDKALPKYGAKLDYGGINQSNDSLSFAEASAYADNMQKLMIREFTSGTISTQALYQSVAIKSAVLGTANDGAEGQSYNSQDDAPFGAYGFYCNKMDENKNKYYEAVFYPKVQGYVEGEDYQTKEDSIDLAYDTLNFYIFEPLCGVYKIEKRFTSEDDAKAYLDGLFDGTNQAPSGSDSDGGNTGDTGGNNP